jgi:hypothetical protein
MQELSNGLVVFNATPHAISFWREGWDEVEIAEPDEVISATVQEEAQSCFQPGYVDGDNVWLVTTQFVGNAAGREVIARARDADAMLIVGSIIAAQAYPGSVVAMTTAPGYERAALAEKRMYPDKFIVYPPY